MQNARRGDRNPWLKARGGAAALGAMLVPMMVSVTLWIASTGPAPLARAQAGGSLEVAPQSQSVGAGSTFTIDILQVSDAATAGAQASVQFDPGLLQLIDVQPGDEYADAALLAGKVPEGVPPQTLDEAIDEANVTGELRLVATFFSPGTGSAPAGESVFLTLTMAALPGAGGTSPIGLFEAEMLDADTFEPIPVTTVDGAVTVDGSGAIPPTTPAPGGTAGATAAAGTSPTARRTAVSTVLGRSARNSVTTASMSIAPDKQKAEKGATFSFTVMQQLDGAASAAQAAFTFKKDVVELVGLEPGDGWNADAGALETAVEKANASGELNVTLSPSGAPPVGEESVLLTVTMRGRDKDGTSPIKLTSVDVVGPDGESVPVTATDGEVTVGAGDGSGMSPLLLVGAAIGALAMAGGGATVFVRRQRAGR